MKILALLLLLILTSCASGNGTPLTTGLIVGDSIMAGLPLEKYRGIDLENKAVGGTHCSDSVEVLKASGRQGLVILGCGHNGFIPDRIKASILEAIQFCNFNCEKMIIVNINPVLKYAEAMPDRLEQTIELNAWIEDQGVEVLDFFSWSMANQNTDMFFDTLHPTPAGYEVLLNEVFLTDEVR